MGGGGGGRKEVWGEVRWRGGKRWRYGEEHHEKRNGVTKTKGYIIDKEGNIGTLILNYAILLK